MKKLAVALAATFAILSAQPKTNPKEFERYFLPTNGDTITIDRMDSMRKFLRNNGWDGKTFESWLKTVNGISKWLPYDYDASDTYITWTDAVDYGGLCVNFSVFNAATAKAAGLECALAVIRGASVWLDKEGNVTRLGPGLIPEPESHMVCFVVGKDGKIYAGSRGLSEVKRDTVDGFPIWENSGGAKDVILYPLLENWPDGVEHGTNILPNYLQWAFKNKYFVKINTDGFKEEDWKNTWPDVVKYLKKGYVVIFTRGEPKW
jgi:hypothetical protein